METLLTMDLGWTQSAVTRFERPLLAYVRRMLGDAERSRDVVQDTFLQLCRQSRSDVEPKLAPWLFAVCRRRVIDILRQQNTERRMTATVELSDYGMETKAYETVENRDTSQVLMLHLEDLPDQQREAVLLKFQQGFSYKEIADVMELSVSHVGVLLHTAIKTLRERMSD